jgi:hypothetical protein
MAEIRFLPANESLQKISVLTEVLKAAKDVYLPDKEDKDKLIKTAFDKLTAELKNI